METLVIYLKNISIGENMQTDLFGIYSIDDGKEHEIKEDINNETLKNSTNIKDGIFKYQDYTFWGKAHIVFDRIYEFLAERFPNPNDFILREQNQIDMFVMTETDKIAIEIQSTPSGHTKYNSPSLSAFENMIRKQIEEDISTYERCWFFFDAELYRYIRDKLHKNSAINLTWLRKYIKDGSLKIFIVRYDGDIKELYYKDFDFLSELSMCCNIGKDQDSENFLLSE